MGAIINGGRAALRLLLALALALLGAGVWHSPAAQAATAKATVQLNTVSPAWLTGDRITITGKVTNTSGRAMTQVQVSLWRSFDPIFDHSAMTNVLSSPDDVPLGARTTSPDGNLFNITSDASPTFAKGASAEFTVSATREQLGLPPSQGAYLIGVHVRAVPDGQLNQLVGRARVLLPAQAPTTGSVSPIVVLTSRPSMVTDGVFADDHLAGELRGRLEALMTAAEQPSSVVLVDPALYDELASMRNGYSLLSGDADPAGQTRAAAWLARLHTVLERQGAYRLPYGDPDLLTTPPDAVGAVVGYSLRALPDDHPLASLALALAPRSGQADAELLTVAEPLAPALLVTGMPERAAAGSLQGVTVINADPTLKLGGPGPSPSATLPQKLGRLLTEVTLRPEVPAVLMIRETADVQLLRALPPQLHQRLALDLPSRPVTLPTKVTVPTSDDSLYPDIQRGRERILSWADLTGGTEAAEVVCDRMSAKVSSSSFGTDTFAARVYLSQVVLVNGPDVGRAKITISSAKSFVMSSETTSFPITVTNNEGQPVKIKVRFVSENPQRVTIPDTAVVTVAPGETESIQFTPKASTNGGVTVLVQVTTSDGHPVGPARRVTVTATSLGDIGWIIIIASGIVLLGTTALRIRQVQRERALSQAAPPPAEIDLVTAVERQSREDSGRPHP